MLDKESTLSVEEFSAIEILREAASITAEEVRFTAYRPANEVSIRYKLPTYNGQQKFLNQCVVNYRDGVRIVRTLLVDLCGFHESDPETQRAVRASFYPEKAQLIGVESGEVRLRAIGSDTPTGFIVIVTLDYPNAKAGIASAAH